MKEIVATSEEFEQKLSREIERTYVPLFPDQLNYLRRKAMPIEQLYLSHPVEPFSLRLRETLCDGELVYTATLKDRGQQTPNGLDRLEIETPINASTYGYYRAREHVPIRKLRATPTKGVAVDWFENGHIHIECEHPSTLETLRSQYSISEQHLIDMTGKKITDNEWRAYREYHQIHNSREKPSPHDTLDAYSVAECIITTYQSQGSAIATISGRSGSGKSTIVRETQAYLQQYGIENVVISTDDYHRGKTWLEHYKGGTWTEWDAPIVYDIVTLQNDLDTLRSGQTIMKRTFDFTAEEPIKAGVIEAAPVILIEGIYARDKILEPAVDLRFEIPTPLATCVGRRLLRDLRERPQFAKPEKSLRYILEQAEPAWQAQTNL